MDIPKEKMRFLHTFFNENWISEWKAIGGKIIYDKHFVDSEGIMTNCVFNKWFMSITILPPKRELFYNLKFFEFVPRYYDKLQFLISQDGTREIYCRGYWKDIFVKPDNSDDKVYAKVYAKVYDVQLYMYEQLIKFQARRRIRKVFLEVKNELIKREFSS